MKMKTLGRYILNRGNYDTGAWPTDTPRSLILHDRINNYTTGMEEVPTETLKNLWLVRFGQRAVTLREMYEIRNDDSIMDVARELTNRNLVTEQRHRRVDIDETNEYYVLEK